MITDLDAYDRWVWPVTESRVERRAPARDLVFQRQRVFGLADREVLLWAERRPLPDGVRLEWTTAAEEPLAVAPGAVRTPRNEGFWEVRGAEGQVHVVHEIAVDPGGLVPRWLVELTRARGFARVMSDARAASRRDHAAPGTRGDLE
jgi:hypothetical protein